MQMVIERSTPFCHVLCALFGIQNAISAMYFIQNTTYIPGFFEIPPNINGKEAEFIIQWLSRVDYQPPSLSGVFRSQYSVEYSGPGRLQAKHSGSSFWLSDQNSMGERTQVIRCPCAMAQIGIPYDQNFYHVTSRLLSLMLFGYCILLTRLQSIIVPLPLCLLIIWNTFTCRLVSDLTNMQPYAQLHCLSTSKVK